MNNCPCGSNQSFSNCCEPFVLGDKTPLTAEQLMRSRYTAYTQANIDYIQKTMKDNALMGFAPEEARRWACSVNWLGLNVIEHEQIHDSDTAYVTFAARYEQNGRICFLQEKSEFKRVDERWYYVDGVLSPPPNRNDLCPCGSGKKFKKCCY